MKWERLIEARKAAGLTQEALAKEMGYDTATVQRWETCRFEPSLAQLRKLSIILHTSTDWLLYNDGYALAPLWESRNMWLVADAITKWREKHPDGEYPSDCHNKSEVGLVAYFCGKLKIQQTFDWYDIRNITIGLPAEEEDPFSDINKRRAKGGDELPTSENPEEEPKPSKKKKGNK